MRLSLLRAVALHCRHGLSQRCEAHPACAGKGMVKHINQKQNRRDHYRECGGKEVLRLDVFHSEEKGVGDGEDAANKQHQPDDRWYGIVTGKYSHSAILSQVV